LSVPLQERMEAGLEELLGPQRAHSIELVLAKDGSGVGAAIIAAISDA
jgi:hexokinase